MLREAIPSLSEVDYSLKDIASSLVHIPGDVLGHILCSVDLLVTLWRASSLLVTEMYSFHTLLFQD
uniref:Uncharacterized protein n=1 Tax=Anguilla anguilla TaxID=7936 RepID=A0A0E9WV33_ANGAN